MSATQEAPTDDFPRRRTLLREAALAVLLASVTALVVRHLGAGPVTVPIGGFDTPWRGGPWGKALRADLDPPASRDGRLTFYFRPLRDGAFLRLPVVPHGPMRVAFRARAMVRSSLGAFAQGVSVPEVLIDTGPWDRYELEVPAAAARADGVTLALFLRARPVVVGAHAGRPEILVDEVTLAASDGLALAWPFAILLGAAPLAIVLFARALGHRPRTAWALGVAGAIAAATLVKLAPLPTLAAVQRLLPMALGGGLLARLVLRRCAALDGSTVLAWTWILTAGLVLRASLPFFPDHNPPDLQTHVDRTLDFADVPWDYGALLRYGSHLPTASQTAAPGTDLFGSTVLVPYPPLPYFVYYALARLGADPLWAMTAVNVLLALAVAPVLFLAARHVWDARAAWLASALYLLDLAVWHHVGRVHAPATFGAALGTAALLALAATSERMTSVRPVALMGGALGLAVLGYSALVVQVGFFGVVLLVLLLLDAAGLGTRARVGVAIALAAGGLVAVALYYGHYVPGLVHGAPAVEAEPSIFSGRTVLGIFRNEGRQSYRIWILGFAAPLVAGLLAAPWALRRARASARPVLIAWLLAWALIMLLKDPLFFPKMLRWAKEDQFVSPLLCLLVGAGVAAIRPTAWRRAAAAVVLAVALALAVRDFYFHANTLWL
jgi:hypothetical protein